MDLPNTATGPRKAQMAATWQIGVIAAMALLATACSSSRPAAPYPEAGGPATDPLTLTPAPGARGDGEGDDDTIETGRLDEKGDEEGTGTGTESGADGETGTASAPPPPAAPAVTASLNVGKADLAGGWTLESGGETCQLFMSLTSWSGGYRATTKGCNLPHLVAIASWNLNGKQVQLKNAKGEILAYLYPTAAERFTGSTHRGGTQVGFYR